MVRSGQEDDFRPEIAHQTGTLATGMAILDPPPPNFRWLVDLRDLSGTLLS